MRILLALMLLAFTSQADAGMLVRTLAGGTPTTQSFYSDFEDATDRSQWGTLPTGWDDEATSGALEGTYSLQGDSDSEEHTSVAFSPISSGTVYARMAFETTDTFGNDGNAIRLKLYSDSTSVASCFTYWHGSSDVHLQLKPYDYTTLGSVTLSPTSKFADGKYYLEMTYDIGTSIKCEIKNASEVVVSSSTVTLNTAQSTAVNKVAVGNSTSATAHLYDEVEVRTDANWGTP